MRDQAGHLKVQQDYRMPRIAIVDQQSEARGGGNLPQMSSADPFGAALSNVASVGAGIAKQIQHQNEQDAIAWTSSQIAKDQVEWRQHMLDRQESAGPAAAGFTPAILKDYDDWAGKSVQAAPTDSAKKFYSEHVSQLRNSVANDAISFQAQSGRNYRMQQVSEGIDFTSKAIQNHPDDANFSKQLSTQKQLIGQLALTPDEKLKVNESLVDGAYTGLWLGRIDNDPQSALKQLKSEGDPIVDGTPFRIRNQMMAHAEQQSSKLTQTMQTQLNLDTQNAETQAQLGLAPTDRGRTKSEFMAAYKDPVVAGEKWAQYSIARDTADSVSVMKSKPSNELMSIVQNEKATDPNDPHLHITARNELIQRAAAATIVQNRQKDPWQYAIDNGEFNAAPIDPSSPDFAMKARERVAALPGISQQYGMTAPQVFSGQETKALTRQLDSLPAQQKVEMLQKMHAGIGNDAVFSNVMQTIRPDSPVTSFVGAVASMGGDIHLDTGVLTKTKVATTIAMGEDLLNQDKQTKASDGKKGSAFVMPKDSEMRSVFMEQVGDAYAGMPQNLERDYQAFRAYYAGDIAQKHGGIASDEGIDSHSANDAVIAATGGVTNWGGAKNTILPYGMPEDEFKDKVTNMWSKLQPELGAMKTSIKDISLIPSGSDGRYALAIGTQLIHDKKGNAVVIDVGRYSYPKAK